MAKPTRLSYLAYRCRKCNRLLTAFEIEKAWTASEAGKYTPVCPCGGGEISPTNCKLWEELLYPRVWKLWWKAVVLPKFGR